LLSKKEGVNFSDGERGERNCHTKSAALSLLAKTLPPAAIGFGRTGAGAQLTYK